MTTFNLDETETDKFSCKRDHQECLRHMQWGYGNDVTKIACALCNRKWEVPYKRETKSS